MDQDKGFTYKKSLWELFQDQKHEPWPFLDFQEFKAWYLTQQKRNKAGYERIKNTSSSRV